MTAPRAISPLWRSAAYLAAFGVSRLVPERIGAFIADASSTLAHSLKTRERESVRRNLSVIMKLPTGSSEVRSAARQVYANFGRACLMLLYETRRHRPGAVILPDLRIESMDIFEKTLSEGNGVILVGPHVGCWELGAMALATRGYPLSAVAHPPAFGAGGLYQRLRERASLRTLSARSGALGCVRTLRQGGAIGIMTDRRFEAAALETDFFGRPSLLPQGAARLALSAGSPIIGAAMTMSGNGPCLRFYERIDARQRGVSAEDDIRPIHRRLAGVMERIVRDFPEQWFCFEDFWAAGDRESGP